MWVTAPTQPVEGAFGTSNWIELSSTVGEPTKNERILYLTLSSVSKSTLIDAIYNL